jgi:hypothetical protein
MVYQVNQLLGGQDLVCSTKTSQSHYGQISGQNNWGSGIRVKRGYQEASMTLMNLQVLY